MKKIALWIPALFWMAIIFYFSGQQTTGVTGSHTISFISIYWQRYIIFKSFHLAEYAFLFILVNFALNKTPKAFLLSYMYACTDEFHQRYTPSRTSRFTDTIIDLIGITLGYLFLKIIYPRLKLIRKK